MRKELAAGPLWIAESECWGWGDAAFCYPWKPAVFRGSHACYFQKSRVWELWKPLPLSKRCPLPVDASWKAGATPTQVWPLRNRRKGTWLVVLMTPQLVLKEVTTGPLLTGWTSCRVQQWASNCFVQCCSQSALLLSQVCPVPYRVWSLWSWKLWSHMTHKEVVVVLQWIDYSGLEVPFRQRKGICLPLSPCFRSHVINHQVHQLSYHWSAH